MARSFARRAPSCFVEASAAAGAAERLGFDRARLRTWSASEDARRGALPVEGGFRAAFAPYSSIIDAPALDAFREAFDRVVIDSPPIDLLPSADVVAVVVVAGVVSAARRAVSLTDRADAIVLNRVGGGGETTRAGFEAVLGARVALELPQCPALRDSDDDGRLLRAGSRWSRKVERLALSIERETQ
jgi:hypothetical protein